MTPSKTSSRTRPPSESDCTCSEDMGPGYWVPSDYRLILRERALRTGTLYRCSACKTPWFIDASKRLRTAGKALGPFPESYRQVTYFIGDWSPARERLRRATD